MINTKRQDSIRLTCLKALSRKVLNRLKRKASISKAISKGKTTKFFVSHFLEFSLRKNRSKCLHIKFRKCCVIFIRFASPQWGKLLLRNYHNVWIMRGLFGKHFQSTGPENYRKVFILSLLRKWVFPFLCMTGSHEAPCRDGWQELHNESRFSKITELIKSKNSSFERFLKAQES